LFHGVAFSSNSYLYILLKAYTTAELPATRIGITSLLKKILFDGILFQEDADEVSVWLDSLPTTRRAPGAEAPDGAALTDEGESVVTFLDDCIRRCVKTPYRYLEHRDMLAQSATSQRVTRSSETSTDHQGVHCSPLLITVLDQLGIKLAGKLLTPSDTLAVTSFIRKLVFKLSSKERNQDFLNIFTDRIDALVHTGMFSQYPSITAAIRREIAILRTTLRHLQNPPVSRPTSTSFFVLEFFDRIEQLPTRQYLFIFLIYGLSKSLPGSCIYDLSHHFSLQAV